MIYSKVLITAIIILSMFLFPIFSLAQETNNSGYFEFQLSENLLKDGQEVLVKFVWDIKDFDMKDQKRLTVKPFLSSGAVEIYNLELDRYIGMAELNSVVPYLQEEMLLKFNGVQSSLKPLVLKFIIYDTLTGKNYTTPDKKVWGTVYYKKYTELLNEKLLKEFAANSTVASESTKNTEPTVVKSQDPVKLYLWYLSPAFFLYGLLKSPNGFG